jgi:hypothetical protein
MNLSNYGKVGDEIRWVSAAGVCTGIIERIDRDEPTADPVIKADYYTVRLHRHGNAGVRLNSNMMKGLHVTNMTIYNAAMEAR